MKFLMFVDTRTSFQNARLFNQPPMVINLSEMVLEM